MVLKPIGIEKLYGGQFFSRKIKILLIKYSQVDTEQSQVEFSEPCY
jgi:hypothetical protein